MLPIASLPGQKFFFLFLWAAYKKYTIDAIKVKTVCNYFLLSASHN